MSLEEPHKYLLGLFDLRANRLIGCAAVKTQIGKDCPFINFDIKGDGPEQCLQASSRFTGATEVGSLFLHPDYRADGLGRYLAKKAVRFMTISLSISLRKVSSKLTPNIMTVTRMRSTISFP